MNLTGFPLALLELADCMSYHFFRHEERPINNFWY